MLRYTVRRLLFMIPIILGISFLVLIFIDITPGDPARMMLGDRATEEEIAALREDLGLNDSLLVRYVRFLKNIVKGDFGTSYATGRPVFNEMMQRLPYTLLNVTLSLIIAVALGIPIGVFAATHQYTWKDNAAIFASLFFVSMPAFWFALILVQVFAVKLNILPPAGIETWKGWILPAFSLSLGFAAVIARQTRSSFLEVIRQDYITTARAKGLGERSILFRHALKNALIPVSTVIGSIFGLSIGSTLVGEVIFSIPGLGSYIMAGLSGRDYPVIQGSVLVLSIFFSLVMMVVDLLFAFVDPRIRVQFTRKKKKSGEGA